MTIQSIHDFVTACKKLAEQRGLYQNVKEEPVKWFRNLTAVRGKYGEDRFLPK